MVPGGRKRGTHSIRLMALDPDDRRKMIEHVDRRNLIQHVENEVVMLRGRVRRCCRRSTALDESRNGARAAWLGDRDEAISLLRAAVDHLVREGQLLAHCIPATGALVETLLDRRAESDVVEAEAAIERLATAPADDGLAVRDIWLLRLRALLARAHGDDARYREYRDRYRAMATSLGFEGHMKWAEVMQ